MQAFRIAPSILSADFAHLGDEVTAVIAAGADLIHVDVMDNHYVPNLTIGPMVCAALQRYATVPLDVHLMVKPVDSLIPAFAKAGASMLSFHPEASEHIDRTLSIIRDAGIKAGLALNPATPLCLLDHVLDKLDFVLIMSVNPGFGGQQFIAHTLTKVSMLRQRIALTDREINICVDGGVNEQNIESIGNAGADTFVAGNAIFASGDYSAAIARMRRQLSMVGR